MSDIDRAEADLMAAESWVDVRDACLMLVAAVKAERAELLDAIRQVREMVKNAGKTGGK